jgi:hypothetical protein
MKTVPSKPKLLPDMTISVPPGVPLDKGSIEVIKGGSYEKEKTLSWSPARTTDLRLSPDPEGSVQIMLLLTDPKFKEVTGQLRSPRRTTGAMPKFDPSMVMDVPPAVGARA